jgi:hypothetical protein
LNKFLTALFGLCTILWAAQPLDWILTLSSPVTDSLSRRAAAKAILDYCHASHDYSYATNVTNHPEKELRILGMDYINLNRDSIAYTYVKDHIRDSDADVREAAIVALPFLGNRQDAISTVLPMLDAKDQKTCFAAIFALGLFHDRDIGFSLWEKYLHENDSDYKKVYLQSLSNAIPKIPELEDHIVKNNEAICDFASVLSEAALAKIIRDLPLTTAANNCARVALAAEKERVAAENKEVFPIYIEVPEWNVNLVYDKLQNNYSGFGVNYVDKSLKTKRRTRIITRLYIDLKVKQNSPADRKDNYKYRFDLAFNPALGIDCKDLYFASNTFSSLVSDTGDGRPYGPRAVYSIRHILHRMSPYGKDETITLTKKNGNKSINTTKLAEVYMRVVHKNCKQ